MPLFLEAKLKKQYPGPSVVFLENRANGAAAINTLSRQVQGSTRCLPLRASTIAPLPLATS